jgi:tetratricopeptide (TPR) repeat protein
MRRGAHRSRPADRESGQIRLDFESVSASRAGASVVSIASHRAARAASAASPRATPSLDRPAPGPSSIERSAAEWFELGYELEASSIDQAREAYQRAVAADDGHADAHLNLGRLLHESGDVAGAERHYRRALEVVPDDATAAFNLGVALEDLHRELQAITAYERAMAADPDFLDAYHNVVRLLEKRGDKAGAVRVLKRLRERIR